MRLPPRKLSALRSFEGGAILTKAIVGKFHHCGLKQVGRKVVSRVPKKSAFWDATFCS